MDSDSFLDLLSPGFNELDAVVWGSPGADSSPAASLSWLADGFINTDGLQEYVEEEEEEAEEQQFCEDQLLQFSKSQLPSSPPSPCPSSALNCTILPNASAYSSVLKLSDIASALRNFSKANGTHHCQTPVAAPVPPKHTSSTSAPHSPPLPVSSFGTLSSLPSVCALSKFSSNALQVHSPSFDASCPTHHIIKDVSFPHVEDMSSPQIQASSKQSSHDSGAANEKESSSKVTSDGANRWDVSANEDDDIDDEGDNESAYYEDVKPCVPHVRIIRRPNSNCGQLATAPSPKRAKMAHVKAEATSSCEVVSLLDDEDGASDLKQMRKVGMSQREVHILSERQRRKSMRESFSILQSLVPKLNLKHTDRITVLTEVITYIQSLRGALEELEMKKADMMELLGLNTKAKSLGCHMDMQGSITYIDSNGDGGADGKTAGGGGGGWCNLQNGERVAMVEVTVRLCGADVFITLNTPHQRGVWSGVLSLLQKFSIEVSNATLATSGDSSFHCIHAKATKLSRVEGVDLQEKLEGVIVKELRRPPRKGIF